MKNIIITKGNVSKIIINSNKYGKKEVLIDTNKVNLASKYTWSVQYDKKGKTFYIKTHVKTDTGYKTLFLHRLLCGNNTPCVDHINHNTLDNRVQNLRGVSFFQNNNNRARNTSGISGVFFDKNANKWRAQIRVNGKLKDLGRFNDIKLAAIARQAAEFKYYFEFVERGDVLCA